jgi:hypothetical protein
MELIPLWTLGVCPTNGSLTIRLTEKWESSESWTAGSTPVGYAIEINPQRVGTLIGAALDVLIPTLHIKSFNLLPPTGLQV